MQQQRSFGDFPFQLSALAAKGPASPSSIDEGRAVLEFESNSPSSSVSTSAGAVRPGSSRPLFSALAGLPLRASGGVKGSLTHLASMGGTSSGRVAGAVGAVASCAVTEHTPSIPRNIDSGPVFRTGAGPVFRTYQRRFWLFCLDRRSRFPDQPGPAFRTGDLFLGASLPSLLALMSTDRRADWATARALFGS